MDLQLGNTYSVVPEQFKPFGVIVRMTDGTTELIHISRVAKAFVQDPSEYLEIGKSYIASGVKGNKRPVELSFIPTGLRRLDGRDDAPAASPSAPKRPSPQVSPKQRFTMEGRPLRNDNPPPRTAFERDFVPASVSRRQPVDAPVQDVDKMLAKAEAALKDKTGFTSDQANKRRKYPNHHRRGH